MQFLFLVFPYFFVSVPCARLSWPYRQLLSAHKYIIAYRIIYCFLTANSQNVVGSKYVRMFGQSRTWSDLQKTARFRTCRYVAVHYTGWNWKSEMWN